MNEIKNHIQFKQQVQLFQLIRLLSPNVHKQHSNRYRDTLVMVGNHICPEPNEIQGLVSQLFYNIERIEHSTVRAIYFHHELIRIHPFLDGNGRVSRIAKNWILMYDLYPPVFIKNEIEKKEYISTLSQSFENLENTQPTWNNSISNFFDDELDRVLYSINIVTSKMLKTELNGDNK